MKSALASLGGALAMLLVMAAWQARTSALPLAPSNATSWSPAGSVPASQLAAMSPGPGAATLVPVSYVTPGYQGVPSNLVQLDAQRPVPVRSTTYRAPRRAYREARPHRNWAKTALVIGGSAGAGAGVGAIAGGKKGALIGAALGGGAASLFEAFKR